MNKYPRSIRYALSTYSNNLRKERNKSESQRLHSQGNPFSNSLINEDNSKISEKIYPYPIQNSLQNKYNYQINSEMDDIKNKTEARQLIEQTKKMMEEYSLNKLKKQNRYNNILNTKISKNNIQIHHNTNFKNKSSSNFDLHLNFNSGNNLENNSNTNKRPSILNKDRLDQLAGKPDSIDVLTQKLIYKNREIKILERELKERTNQLKACQERLNSKNIEIKKLLENLDNERSNSLKVENSKLNKKIFNLEKSNDDIKRICDKNIEELKSKLNDLNKLLENYKNKNTELENKNLILRQDNEKLREMLEEKNNLSMVLKEKNDVEKKSNEVNNIEINNLKMNLDNIIVVLKSLFNKESQIYENRNNFLNKLSKLDMRRRIGDDGKVNYYDYGNVNNYKEQRYINNERRMGLNNNSDNFEI
jgi:reticulocyte-binding protein